ncbi:MAG: helix-turn-helix domain-containing protein [Acidobacteria bacterium]|nr:helix-turn-helix domain-containing protein [Acidobacteriota bacterium]
MAASFGEQLRLAREARGISLREISEQTRISTRYLEAIESGDLKRLPGGIFNRSFIKAYAKYVGYDEREALEAYARTAREQGASPDEVTTTPYKSHVYTDGNGARSPLVTLVLTILILAILSLGVYAALHWYQRHEADKPNEPATPAAPAQQQAATTTPNNPAAAPVTAGFVIQLKAVNQEAWVKTRVDDEVSQETILQPGAVKEFRPTQSLSIKYAKIKAPSLELTINGRPANVTASSTTNPVEMVITKDDYQKFLQ